MKKHLRYRILTHAIGDPTKTKGVRGLFDNRKTAESVAERLRKYDLYDMVEIDEFEVYAEE